jgi:hypothetical protein
MWAFAAFSPFTSPSSARLSFRNTETFGEPMKTRAETRAGRHDGTRKWKGLYLNQLSGGRATVTIGKDTGIAGRASDGRAAGRIAAGMIPGNPRVAD